MGAQQSANVERMTPKQPKHPAPYSAPVLDVLARLLRAEQRRRRARGESGFLLVLDPFAGTGRIHRLQRPGSIETTGVELEPEWAAMHKQTQVGDATKLPHWWGRRFDVVATSPCYGNRYADHHDAKDGSERRSYAHDLGRRMSKGSAAELAWGPAYWTLHGAAYRELFRVLRPGGLLLLNVSDFIRDGQLVHAVEWHHGAAIGAGFEQRPNERPRAVPTRRMRKGANSTARASHEVVLQLRRPS